jgi:hypothetical protein
MPRLGIHIKSLNNASLRAVLKLKYTIEELKNYCLGLAANEPLSNKIHQDDVVLSVYPPTCTLVTNDKPPYFFSLEIYDKDKGEKIGEEEIKFEVIENGHYYQADSI